MYGMSLSCTHPIACIHIHRTLLLWQLVVAFLLCLARISCSMTQKQVAEVGSHYHELVYRGALVVVISKIANLTDEHMVSTRDLKLD